MAKIVLCSASPRRQELLRHIGISDFDIRIPDADESVPAGLTAQETVQRISRQKALAGRTLCADDEICITADTMVFLDDVRLGKPADEADALRMLTALQGRGHTVCTGVTVCRGEEMITECETTEVRFRAASEQELLAYIRTGEPMDKAGAYGIQGGAALFAEKMHGDYYNVMGLPVCRLWQMLRSIAPEIMEDPL